MKAIITFEMSNALINKQGHTTGDMVRELKQMIKSMEKEAPPGMVVTMVVDETN